jgi:hypothetical protein
MDRRAFIAGLSAAGAAMMAKAEATGIVSEALAEEVEHTMFFDFDRFFFSGELVDLFFLPLVQ